MRELIARMVCFLSVAAVVVLAHLFAARHNPPAVVESPTRQVSEPAPPSEVVRGRQVYAEQVCSSCHAIAGAGNPRNPLDGVGTRRSAGELRDWITGTGPAMDQLSPAVVRRKQRYQELPDAELKALTAYLASLTAKS